MGLLVDGRGQDEWYDTKSTGGGGCPAKLIVPQRADRRWQSGVDR